MSPGFPATRRQAAAARQPHMQDEKRDRENDGADAEAREIEMRLEPGLLTTLTWRSSCRSPSSVSKSRRRFSAARHVSETLIADGSLQDDASYRQHDSRLAARPIRSNWAEGLERPLIPV